MVPFKPNRLVFALLLNYLNTCLNRAEPFLRDVWLIYDPQWNGVVDEVSILLGGRAVRVVALDNTWRNQQNSCTVPVVVPNVISLVTAERLSELLKFVYKCVTAKKPQQKHFLVVHGSIPGNMKLSRADVFVHNAITGDLTVKGNVKDICTDVSRNLPTSWKYPKPIESIAFAFMVPGFTRFFRVEDKHKDVVIGSGVSAIRVLADTLGLLVSFKQYEPITLTIKQPSESLLPGQLTNVRPGGSSNHINTKVFDTKPFVYPYFQINLVVIVPFDVITESNIAVTVVRKLPIILVWVTTALLFTTLRLCVAWLQQFQSKRKQPFAYMYFDTLARTLGSSCGDDRDNRSTALLIFALSCFSILASAVCAGSLYEEHFSGAPQQRIDTIDDFIASGMPTIYIDSCFPRYKSV